MDSGLWAVGRNWPYMSCTSLVVVVGHGSINSMAVIIFNHDCDIGLRSPDILLIYLPGQSFNLLQLVR